MRIERLVRLESPILSGRPLRSSSHQSVVSVPASPPVTRPDCPDVHRLQPRESPTASCLDADDACLALLAPAVRGTVERARGRGVVCRHEHALGAGVARRVGLAEELVSDLPVGQLDPVAGRAQRPLLPSAPREAPRAACKPHGTVVTVIGRRLRIAMSRAAESVDGLLAARRVEIDPVELPGAALALVEALEHVRIDTGVALSSSRRPRSWPPRSRPRRATGRRRRAR